MGHMEFIKAADLWLDALSATNPHLIPSKILLPSSQTGFPYITQNITTPAQLSHDVNAHTTGFLRFPSQHSSPCPKTEIESILFGSKTLSKN